MDTNSINGKKLHGKQHIHKTITVWPLISHLTDNPNKMSNLCGALLEKQG